MSDQNQNDTELDETVADRFDAGVAKVARESYHTPPETPRDDMWAVIQAARAADVVPIRRIRPQPWWAAVAAALVIGVVLGRGTLVGPDQATTVADGSTEAPAAVDGELVIRPMMRVTLSADHRVVDGADAARYLGTLAGLLETN